MWRGGRGRGGRASGRIGGGVCYTRGARSRRWCGWWVKGGGVGDGGGWELQQWHGRLICRIAKAPCSKTDIFFDRYDMDMPFWMEVAAKALAEEVHLVSAYSRIWSL